jgi:uncharacterized protein
MTDQPLTSDERDWAMWAHLCGLAWVFAGSGLLFLPFGGFALFTLLGPLIIWRSKRETMPFAAAQAKESLNFQITVWLLGVVSWVLAFVLIGFLFLAIIGIVDVVLVVIAAIQVRDGKPYRYPFCLRLVA